MLLAIDAGNTNTVFAVFDKDVLKGQWRMATNGSRTSDEYGVWLLQLLARGGIKPEQIKSVILSSVVPQANFAIKTLSREYFGTEIRIIGHGGLKVDMEVKVDRQAELGADRLVNAYSAWLKYNQACIVVDFGTATTFDVINDKGAYIGGVIAPGINLSIEALHKAAAKLPNVDVVHPEKVIGTTTVTAMQSGIFYGYLGLIEGIVSRIRGEYAGKMMTIATGGLAPLYTRATTVIENLEPDLTIIGLKEIHKRNPQ